MHIGIDEQETMGWLGQRWRRRRRLGEQAEVEAERGKGGTAQVTMYANHIERPLPRSIAMAPGETERSGAVCAVDFAYS